MYMYIYVHIYSIQCVSSAPQSSSKPPESPSSRSNLWKPKVFVRFSYVNLVACQYSDLEAQKVTTNIPIWTHGAQSDPTVNPGAPKIHIQKMFTKWSCKVKMYLQLPAPATNVIPSSSLLIHNPIPPIPMTSSHHPHPSSRSPIQTCNMYTYGVS